jgi:hypothetical protein
MVFEDKILRGMLEPKKEITGGWETLHNEDLHNLYSSPNAVEKGGQTKIMRCARHVTRIREIRNDYRVLVINPEEKKPDGKLGHRWALNINRSRVEG